MYGKHTRTHTHTRIIILKDSLPAFYRAVRTSPHAPHMCARLSISPSHACKKRDISAWAVKIFCGGCRAFRDSLADFWRIHGRTPDARRRPRRKPYFGMSRKNTKFSRRQASEKRKCSYGKLARNFDGPSSPSLPLPAMRELLSFRLLSKIDKRGLAKCQLIFIERAKRRRAHNSCLSICRGMPEMSRNVVDTYVELPFGEDEEM